ncbi:MAG: hypothetical protein PHU08_07640 [Dehalococcoidales bacterium]|nr:hypothetical protein [Dehalococcoidales bacterium]
MNRFVGFFNDRLLNGGTTLVIMGCQWLYLWVFPWYHSYVNNPHWGHNYAESIAFLALGLAYFNRRLVSYVLAFIATLMIIPASLELLPHPATAIIGGVMAAAVIVDIVVERKRQYDLGQPANRQLAFWLKKHLPRLSFIMLAHIALIYFLVRLFLGTYETDTVTKVFDGLLFPFVFMLLFEDMPGITDETKAKRVAFFWGMAIMVVSLGILSHQPETQPALIVDIVVTILGIIALTSQRKHQLELSARAKSGQTAG